MLIVTRKAVCDVCGQERPLGQVYPFPHGDPFGDPFADTLMSSRWKTYGDNVHLCPNCSATTAKVRAAIEAAPQHTTH
jgi:hypothetical protein